MKKHFLNYLVCPSCAKSLSLKVFKESEGEIKEGELYCQCGRIFAVTNFIPRMVVSEDMSPEKEKTAESFAFEWQKFNEMRGEWQKNFDFYFEPVLHLPAMKNKTALEIGCGNGRHSFYASDVFGEVVSVDLGYAVDVAHENNKQKNNIHFVQADVYNLPFKKEFFDFVFSIGVLHHLPNPEQGYAKMLSHLKNGGGALVYLYHSFPKTHFNFYLLGLVNFFRKITTRLPHKILYILCWPVAILSYVILVLPYKYVFRYFVRQGWPLGNYANYSFFVMLNDTFDRFSAPIENRYSKNQVQQWLHRAGLKNTNILGGSGWRAFGQK